MRRCPDVVTTQSDRSSRIYGNRKDNRANKPMALDNFELFARTPKAAEQPGFSIQSGRFVMNAPASRILSTAKAEAVQLWCDSVARKIAVKVANKADPSSYTLNVSSRKTGATSVTVRLFLRKIGWTAEKRVAVPATWDLDEQALIATLPSEWLPPLEPGTEPAEKSTD